MLTLVTNRDYVAPESFSGRRVKIKINFGIARKGDIRIDTVVTYPHIRSRVLVGHFIKIFLKATDTGLKRLDISLYLLASPGHVGLVVLNHFLTPFPILVGKALAYLSAAPHPT